MKSSSTDAGSLQSCLLARFSVRLESSVLVDADDAAVVTAVTRPLSRESQAALTIT